MGRNKSNGWTQLKNIDSGTNNWFGGNDLTISSISFDYVNGNPASGEHWSIATPSELTDCNELCIQTMDVSGGTSRTYWLITTRTNWNSALLSSSSTVVLPTLASSDGEVSMMPLITDTDSDYQERPLVF